MLPIVLALVALVGLVTDGPRIEKYKIRGPVLVIAAILGFAAMIRPVGMVIASYVTFMVAILGSREMRVLESIIAAAVMTAPMIGNYGINSEDPESARPQVAGVVVRELSRQYSNWRATGDLGTWLDAAKVPILEGVDTRQLTRHLRSAGVMRGVIDAGEAVSEEAKAALDACPSMEGLDLASTVTTDASHGCSGSPRPRSQRGLSPWGSS